MEISPELVSKIADLCSKGYSVKKIAETLGIDERRLYVIIKYYGIKPSSRGLSSEVIRGIVHDYLKGMLAGDVARKYGVSEETVRYILKSLGAKRGPKTLADMAKQDPVLARKVEKIKELAIQGFSDEMIGEVVGLSKWQVKKIRRELGIRKFNVAIKPKLVNTLIELLRRQGVLDSLAFKRATGQSLNISIIQDAAKKLEIGYGQITGTSTAKHRVFPAEYCEKYIVYLKEKERDALLYLLKLADPKARLNAIKNRVKGPLSELIPDTNISVAKYLNQLTSSR